MIDKAKIIIKQIFGPGFDNKNLEVITDFNWKSELKIMMGKLWVGNKIDYMFIVYPDVEFVIKLLSITPNDTATFSILGHTGQLPSINGVFCYEFGHEINLEHYRYGQLFNDNGPQKIVYTSSSAQPQWSKNKKQDDEINQWVNKNNIELTDMYEFTNDSDRMLYKLRWA